MYVVPGTNKLKDFARRNVVWERDEAEDEWVVAHDVCARFVRLSDEEQDRWIGHDSVWRQERSYRSDLESKGRRRGITKEDFKELLISAVLAEIKKLYFKNIFRSPGEKVHGLDIEVSVIRIPEEEQKQYLDRKIVNEAEERMAMLLEAMRL
jgi:hypothetical protein